mmetsp:Transcript_34025/g.79293  ORF Transcript_34025/g.79293 Transcript_34025/m.79293 type:complete len:207 (+) Transcript_34025:822-1442(+)
MFGLLSAQSECLYCPACHGPRLCRPGSLGLCHRHATVYDGLPGLYQKQQADTGMCDGHLSLDLLHLLAGTGRKEMRPSASSSALPRRFCDCAISSCLLPGAMAAGPYLLCFRWPDCSGCTFGPSTEEHVGLSCGAGSGAGCSRFHVQGCGDSWICGLQHHVRVHQWRRQGRLCRCGPAILRTHRGNLCHLCDLGQHSAFNASAAGC